MTKHALNVHAGHDDYHAVDDTGFFQLFAKDVQEAADLNLIAHRIAELSLNPGHLRAGRLPHQPRDRVAAAPRARAHQGVPRRSGRLDRLADAGAAPRLRRQAPPHPRDVRLRLPGDAGRRAEPGQLRPGRRGAAAVLLRPHRRRSPTGRSRSTRALTGRRYARAMRLPARGRRVRDRRAGLGRGQRRGGRRLPAREARAQGRRRSTSRCSARSLPTSSSTLLAGKKGVVVLERTDQPLAVDPPLLREIRAAMSQGGGERPVPQGRAAARRGSAACRPSDGARLLLRLLRPRQPRPAARRHRRRGRQHARAAAEQRQFYLGIDFIRHGTRLPKLDLAGELSRRTRISRAALTPART